MDHSTGAYIGIKFSESFKTMFMPIPAHNSKASHKSSKGDTSRTSNQGRKTASGGSTETNNQGRPKGNNPQQKGAVPVTARRSK
jgi:hypothetical protein